MNGFYVFALTRASVDSFEAGGHRIEFVDLDGIYAAVERTAAAPAVSEQALREQHETVVAIAERVDAVLPARFGAFVEAGELRAVVSQRRETILDALALVKGRRQMTIRVLGVQTVAAQSTLRPIGEAATGTEYLQQRREALAPKPMPALRGSVAAAVKGFIRAERTEPGRGRVVLTMYHLVDATDVAAYRAALDALELAPGELTLSVSGPWPAFAFAPEWWS